MTGTLRRLAQELGFAGWLALAIGIGAALFSVFEVQPLEAENAELAQRVARLSDAAAEQPSTAAEKVAAVYRYLAREEETTDWLAALHGIGAATGVQLKSANYRTLEPAGRIRRYEIVLPVEGSYPRLRDFLKRATEAIPVMSVDQLTLKRERTADERLQAELRLTLHMVKP